MCQPGLVLGLDAGAWDEAMHSGLLATVRTSRPLRRQLMDAVVYEPCSAGPSPM
jgi:hypothetical protein